MSLSSPLSSPSEVGIVEMLGVKVGEGMKEKENEGEGEKNEESKEQSKKMLEHEEKKIVIRKLQMLECMGCVVPEFKSSDSLDELKDLYNDVCLHRDRCKLYEKLDRLQRLGYLPDYDKSKSIEELNELYRNIGVIYNIFKELCDIHHLPEAKLYNHDDYPVLLSTFLCKQDNSNMTYITDYFNKVFDMNVTKQHVLMVVCITTFKSFLKLYVL